MRVWTGPAPDGTISASGWPVCPRSASDGLLPPTELVQARSDRDRPTGDSAHVERGGTAHRAMAPTLPIRPNWPTIRATTTD